jgi:hypothetical protein
MPSKRASTWRGTARQERRRHRVPAAGTSGRVTSPNSARLGAPSAPGLDGEHSQQMNRWYAFHPCRDRTRQACTWGASTTACVSPIPECRRATNLRPPAGVATHGHARRFPTRISARGTRAIGRLLGKGTVARLPAVHARGDRPGGAEARIRKSPHSRGGVRHRHPDE